IRAAARPRSASSSGPAEIEGATTGAGPDSPGVHVPSVWPLTWTTVGSRRRANVFRNSELARASMHRRGGDARRLEDLGFVETDHPEEFRDLVGRRSCESRRIVILAHSVG